MNKKKTPSFFDRYAHEYDLLTDVRQRIKHHEKEVAAIVERFGPETVLDAGCGTGLTSMLFARQGIRTVGLDRSRAMLAEAKKKYARLRLPLEFRYGNFERLPQSWRGRFDLVVCLANSITGVGTQANLRKALGNFAAVLKPGGALILQMLNFDSMREDRPYPIKATESDGIVYVRFSERRDKSVTLYVVRLDLSRRPVALEVFRHQSDNFTAVEVTRAIGKSAFTDVRRYRDLFLTRRFVKSSRDLVITARKK
jgi:ubiquinone/menaquinone biosynthesis C-methylase UbiE